MDTMDRLQMLALVFEALGFCLAAIEILNEESARRIEAYLLNYLSRERYFALGEDVEEVEEAERKGEHNMAGPLLLLIPAAFFSLYQMEFDNAFVLSLVISLIVVFSLKLSIRVFRRLSRGRALGGAGLVLAMLGIGIEAVQVWAMPKELYAGVVVGSALLVALACVKE